MSFSSYHACIPGETPPPAQPHRAMSLASDATTVELGNSPGTLERATGPGTLNTWEIPKIRGPNIYIYMDPKI